MVVDKLTDLLVLPTESEGGSGPGVSMTQLVALAEERVCLGAVALASTIRTDLVCRTMEAIDGRMRGEAETVSVSGSNDRQQHRWTVMATGWCK